MTVASQEMEQGMVPWWLVLIEGIAALILGILLFTATGTTLLVLVQFLGIYWLIRGIFYIISIFLDSSMWGWKLFAGIVGIIAGVVILQHPLYSTILIPTVTVIVLGIQGLVIGVVDLIRAFQGEGWGAGILGALSILFGILLLANPLIGMLLLPYALGALGVVGGIALIVLAFRVR